MADHSQKLAIIVTAQDLASGKLSKVRMELASMGAGGKLASVGLGGAMLAVNKGEQALGNFKNRLTGIASGLTMLGGVGGAFALGTGLISATNQAKDFGAAMELIRTQAGASQGEVDSMSVSLLTLARSVGTTPETLAAGLYHVESAGLRGAKALDILKVAAQGAKVGGADLESVTNALLAANQSGVKGVQDMSGAMGTLNAIVGSGNMRMQDLTDSFGTGVLSTAKNYGVTIQSVGAALASMTDQGIPATDAATRLNSAMRLMAAPTSKAVKELKSIGLSSTDLAKDMRSPGGMLTAITDLKTHLDKSGLSLTQQAALIAGAFGGKQSGAILTLIGNVDLLKQKTAAVAAGAQQFGDAWAATQQDAQFKWDKFNASLSAAAIKVGTVALPTITAELDDIGTWVDTHGDDLAQGFSAAIGTAKSLAGSLKSVAGAAIGIWDSIPPPMRDLLVKGVVADRTMKFFFGMSPIHAVVSLAEGAIAKGFGGIVGGLFTRGGSPATPMFVSDVAGALGGKGGLPGVGGIPAAVGGAGVLGTLGAIGAAVALAAIPIAAAYGLSKIVNPEGNSGPGMPGGRPLTEGDPGVNAFNRAFAVPAIPPPSKVSDYPQLPGSAAGAPLHGSADRATAGGGAVSFFATIPKNIAVTLAAIGPGAGGVYERAVEKGLHPSMASVAGTLARNTAATAAAAGRNAAALASFRTGERADLTGVKAATAAGAAKTVAAYASYRAGERADLGAVRGAVNATTRAIIAKQFTVAQTVAAYQNYRTGERADLTPVVVHTSSPVSVRDVAVKTATRATYGTGRSIR